MNNNYLKSIDKLSFAKSDIETLFGEAQNAIERSFEDRVAYTIIENIIESLDTAIECLKRYSLPSIEGRLIEDRDKSKFELVRGNGKGLGWFFSCGDYLEVFGEDGEWYAGRVEHTTRENYTGYYFYNNILEHPFLYEGMRIRVRRILNDG